MQLFQAFQNYAHREWQGFKLGLDRIYQACERLGHPERDYRIIHVAGTNGKGSVAAFLQAALHYAGFKAGRFTSPHLVKINERFRIGTNDISDEELESILAFLDEKQLLPFSNRFAPDSPLQLSFFELCTLVAFVYFSRQKVDFAVLETGLGGRLDSTNIVVPLVSVITEISLDHTEILGPDLASIAQEKAGIIKYKAPVVCGATHPDAVQVIHATAKAQESIVIEVPKARVLFDGFFNWQSYQQLKCGLKGQHQIHNASIALTTLNFLQQQGFEIPEFAVRWGLAKVDWPGRLEWFSHDPPILLDGAHNVQGLETTLAFLKTQKVKRWKVLYAAVQKKPILEMLAILNQITDSITLCRLNQARSFDPVSTLADLPSALKPHVQLSEISAFETLQKLVAGLGPDEAVLVVGSLYLVGEIKGMEPEFHKIRNLA